MRRHLGVALLVAVVVLAGCSTTPIGEPTTAPTTESPVTTTAEPSTTTTATTSTPTTTTDPSQMVDSRPDPDEDVLGWENGYWYNESISVDRSDGLNQSELDVVVARSMARVEHIRELEFENETPVKIINRTEFRERTEERNANLTANERLHQNVKFEATFFLGEDESAIQARQDTTASSVLGFYSPRNDSIVIVSDNPDNLEMNEITLSQELFHAVQEQTFNVSNYTANTEELHNARDGIIEGDGNFVDHLYEQRCGVEWDCLMPQSQGGSGGDGTQAHVGMLALRLQPYSDGPVFVRDIYEEENWDGVNAIYESPPESTEQTIHPELYGVDEPSNVTVEDRSNDEWVVPDQGEGHIDYAQFGEAGLYVMLWYPSHVESRESGSVQDVVIPYRDFFSPSEESLDLYNYDHPMTAGWDGDRLLPYVQNDSAETNETGYVWKITWDTQADAEEFTDGYQQLLEHHGGVAVPGSEDTYLIDDGPFEDAFRVSQDGRNVTIVNAPSISELDEVRSDAPASAA